MNQKNTMLLVFQKLALQVRVLEFSNESKLQIIEEGAFKNSTIESILIQKEAIIIGKNAFSGCDKLQRIDFSNESKLQTIEENAFNETSIESVTIQSEVSELKEGWCCGASRLTRVRVSL